MKTIDLTGKRFSKWTVLQANSRDREGKVRWLCRCDCGVEKEVAGKHLRSGTSTQCKGCAHRTHGATSGRQPTAEYSIWVLMIGRCHNPKNHAYERYGGRGIVVCDRWRESFENFLQDMGPRPSTQHQIDRKNNDLGYEPSNCRWATPREQQRNRRNNHVIAAFGDALCLAEWSDRLGIPSATIRKRLKLGWSPERALGDGNGPSLVEARAAKREATLF